MHIRSLTLCVYLTACIFLTPSAANAQVDGEAAAVMETYPEYLLYMLQGVGDARGQAQAAAMNRKWETGRTLRVCFFGGNPVVRHLIAEVAQDWVRPGGANLHFDFGNAPNYRDCLAPDGASSIRIGFSNSGHWSVVGNESNEFLTSLQPSMNFFQFDARYRAPLYNVTDVLERVTPYDRGVILHEFGHAIGFHHEQQHPRLACWEEITFEGPYGAYDIMYRYYLWQRPMVDANLRPIVDRNVTPVTEPNPQSVMMYALDPRILHSGTSSRCYVTPRTGLHASDLAAAAILYPAGQAVVLANNDVSSPLSPMQALPLAAPASARELVQTQITTDLQSPDAFVRRDARARLGDFLNRAPSAEVNAIFDQLVSASYRYQLGVAVAVDHSEVDLTPQMLLRLNQARSRTTDPTLRNALDRAAASASRR